VVIQISRFLYLVHQTYKLMVKRNILHVTLNVYNLASILHNYTRILCNIIAKFKCYEVNISSIVMVKKNDVSACK